MTHILLYVFLTLSVCAPIIPTRPKAVVAEIMSTRPPVSLCYTLKTLKNMPDDVNRENNGEAWVEASDIQLVALCQGLQTF